MTRERKGAPQPPFPRTSRREACPTTTPGPEKKIIDGVDEEPAGVDPAALARYRDTAVPAAEEAP